MAAADEWADFLKELRAFAEGVGKNSAVNINAERLRTAGRQVVQRYFRTVRPSLAKCGMSAERLAAVDTPMQDLMTLTAGQNTKRSYVSLLRPLRKLLPQVEADYEYRLSTMRTAAESMFGSEFATDLHATLERLVPTAANSYLQALRDLSEDSRVSFRGPAAELRETLREVLDRLAPDEQVMKAPGFNAAEMHKGHPTMKQKARFILQARETPGGARESTETALERVEEATAALARSVYTRGSISSHVTTTRTEVAQLKRYVETVLGDLLQVR
jgi:hypothetical protein